MKKILEAAHGHAKRHYETHYKTRYQERAHLVFLLDAVLVSIALGLLGLGLYFRWLYHPLRDAFQLSLVAEQTIVAGKETTFSVQVANTSDRPLRNARLDVHLPKTFIMTQPPEGFDADTSRLTIETMNARARNTYRFRGAFLGSTGGDLYLHFMAQGEDGASDEMLMKGTLTWEANAIEARFEAPESAVPGQAVAFALRIKNGSPFVFDEASVAPVWDESFTLQNATPPVYRGKVALGRLEAGEEVVVSFSGRFNRLLDPSMFRAQLTGTVGGLTLSIAEAGASVRMADVGLRLWTMFSGEAPLFVRPGQEVPVIVGYQNDGKQTIKNITLDVTPDVQTLGDIRWETSNRIDALAPGEHGERTVFVRVRESVSRYVADPVFRAVPQATLSLDAPKITGARVSGTAVEAKIAGSLRLRAVARYFTNEGDQLGRGPLPPRVGDTTRYWLFASLETGATELQDGVAVFLLPEGVRWTGRSAVTMGEDLAQEGGRLVWRIGSMAPHAGATHEAPSASFEVALTPTPAQLGTSPLLLASAAVTARDAWTDDLLESNQAGLTTQLPNDTGVAGRSEVRGTETRSE